MATHPPQISTGTLHPLEAAVPERPGSVEDASFGWLRFVRAVLFVIAALFMGLHFLHLSADFPNHSPWMDWSKYTDEGWYGDAAIRHLQRGRWYVPGDFNPGAALPVWPLLEFLVFSVTGVSIVAARGLAVAVFAAILVVGYLLMKRFSLHNGRAQMKRESVAPEAAVLLLAVSPFCYVFTRLAILEPLLVLLGLLALLAASTLRNDSSRGAQPWSRTAWSVVALGLLMPSMVLTKTTAVFLMPAIAWMLWASSGYKLCSFLRAGVPAVGIGAAVWTAYFALFVRPQFLADYRYLFSANAYTGMTRANAAQVLGETLRDGMWIGGLIYPLALAAVLLALVRFRTSFQNPLVPSLLLWAAGYAAFLAYHDNLQPRYYLVIAVPLTLLIPILVEEALSGYASTVRTRRATRNAVYAVAAAGFLVVASFDARQTLEYVRSPDYTYAGAAQAVHRIVAADRAHNPLILSISGSEISLMTGLPSICDDFGTMTLEQRAAAYRPGWYATWNEVDDDKMDALSPLFHLERVAAFPALDDPERNLLILYRLDPPHAQTTRKEHRKIVPKLLETRLGQQPSTVQLEH